MVATLGAADRLLRVLEGVYPGAILTAAGHEVTVRAAEPERTAVVDAIEQFKSMARAQVPITDEVIERTLALQRSGEPEPAAVFSTNILASRGRKIRPKTANQKKYVDAIDEHDVTFGIGPAGTGKTYLAMAKAVQALQSKEVNRIVLTRPAVEAGERLGYLPGSLSEKIDPYLRPLYDALHDMLDPDQIPRLMASGVIEVAPLAYMRGRTLNDAFVILDEAQNTTAEQMKMFLTRLGFGSKMVITGDISQVDLPRGASSGLRQVMRILDGVEGINFSYLTSEDVVRHALVARIVDAYDKFSQPARSGGNRAERRAGVRAQHRRSGHPGAGNEQS
ncbi:PhoH family protein [Micrococcoides hystricis]|uniref:PhoH-like protein n=1 Tax=Micrococcoides hystricis TaxID=1572761 RepID=A0ABV6P7J6_9MICC